MATNLRGLVVGASTLLGKELIEELNSSSTPWDLQLADTAQTSAQLVAGVDEALVVQPLTPGMFDGRDIVFFAADAPTTQSHWKEATAAGAAVIDSTAALESEPRAVVRSPWSESKRRLTSDINVVVPAHPAAAMVGIISSRLSSAFGNVHLAATLLEPASQQGSAGVDEMHQQTVALLGLHSLPQEIYDAQVAFNLRVSVGEAAKFDMREITATIRRHLKAIAGGDAAASVALQLVQAPVFHGYTMSIYVRLPDTADASAIQSALNGDPVTVVADDDPPSNQSVMQQPGISITVTQDSAHSTETRGYWLWAAADNLKLSAREAIACAEELAALRSSNKPQ